MIKKTVIASLAFGLILFFGTSSFTPPPETDCGCPPGWISRLITDSNNPNLVKDRNGDSIMCYKNLGEQGDGTPKGNNLGAGGSRNWKDNNQPCDDDDNIVEKPKKKK